MKVPLRIFMYFNEINILD